MALNTTKTSPPRQWLVRHDRACTLEAVSIEMGITMERVRQIEKAALEKIKATLDRRGLTFDLIMPDLFEKSDQLD